MLKSKALFNWYFPHLTLSIHRRRPVTCQKVMLYLIEIFPNLTFSIHTHRQVKCQKAKLYHQPGFHMKVFIKLQ